MHKLAQLIYDDASKVTDAVDLSSIHGKSVLLTGATGLVGTYFLASIKKAGEKGIRPKSVFLTVHSDPDAYYLDLMPQGAKLLKGDLTDPSFLESLPEADYVIHAAGYGQPGKFLDDQAKTLKLNTLATFYLLEKLRKGGKFLFLSTSEIYSGSPAVPYKEESIGTTNTTHKRACYIEGKRSGEAISFAYRSKGIEAKAARLSLAYGPGTKKGDARVLNSFIEKGIKGEISMLDSGSAKRTYCYITDAVEMMWDILLHGKEFVYNVGGESKITIGNLAKKIGTYLGVPVKIPSASGMDGAPEDVWLDLSKVKSEFGKDEFVDLDLGLGKTIEWQKTLYKEN